MRALSSAAAISSRTRSLSATGMLSDALNARRSVTVTSAANRETSAPISRRNPKMTASVSIITATLTATAVAATCVMTLCDDSLPCAVRREMNSERCIG